ncbi:unnamed protein product [Auanema sp. JU1783]|nr:unnamed protein product [Auanema sp. JU1783]
MGDTEGSSVMTPEMREKIDALRTFLESLSLSYFVEEGSSESEEYESCEESDHEELTEAEPANHTVPSNPQYNVLGVHQCKTCRSYSTSFLHQHTARFPYLSPIPPITIDVLRVYHLSKDSTFSGPKNETRLELAIIDFVSRKEYAEKYDLSSLLHLGFTCEVRLKSSPTKEQKEVYIARALVGYAPYPRTKMNWSELMSKMEMYGGAMFRLFEPVTCLQTVEMFVKMMEMDKIGAVLRPFNGHFNL